MIYHAHTSQASGLLYILLVCVKWGKAQVLIPVEQVGLTCVDATLNEGLLLHCSQTQILHLGVLFTL